MAKPTLFSKQPEPQRLKEKFDMEAYIRDRNKVLAEMFPDDKDLQNITFGEGKPAYVP